MSLLRCFVCKGRKKIYKIAGAYTMTDVGGSPAIECPECGGLGKVLSEDEKDKLKLEKKLKGKKKDSDNDQRETA